MFIDSSKRRKQIGRCSKQAVGELLNYLMMSLSTRLGLFLILAAVDAHELGGIVCRLPKNSGYSCGVTSSHSAFYFDADVGECIEFLFDGCGGNQNRFTTKDDCEQGCRSLTLCGKGMPLMDFAGNIKRCDGERVPCPGSHTCIGSGMSSVCCLKADRVCQSYVHAGTPCGVPPTTRYYFDFSSKTCRPFAFTGCGGNDNNFKSRGECTKFCSSEVICARGEPHSDRYAVNRIASCLQHSHCPINYTCTARASRKGACCPSKEFVCGSPFEVRSSCRRPLKEVTWWFDFRKGECSKTEHAACDEHINSFANQEQCADYCIGTCPNELEVHFNARSGQPQLCDFKKNEGCPLGFECVKSSPFASICCKTSPVCPAAESLVLLQDDEVKRCDPDDQESCPSEYSCQQAKNLEHICCTRPLACPTGMIALREDGGRPRVCSVGVDGNCPNNHMCVQGDGTTTVGGARHLCCKPEKKCVVPYVNQHTKRPQRCFPGDSSCPSSTTCLPALEDAANITNAIDVMFFCCHTVHVYTCADGTMPLVDEVTNKPAVCLMSNPFSCPVDYVCSGLIDGTYACCPPLAATQTCAEALLGEDGSPVGWDDNSCPRGKCRRAADQQYYCCRTSDELRMLGPSTTFVPSPVVTPKDEPLDKVVFLQRAASSLRLRFSPKRAPPFYLRGVRRVPFVKP